MNRTTPAQVESASPDSGPATLNRMLDATKRVSIEKDTFHYFQRNRRFWVISNLFFAALSIVLALLWASREMSWSRERAEYERRIFQELLNEASENSKQPE